MKIIQNFGGILMGLFVALLIITIGITIDHRWFKPVTSHEINHWADVYKHWSCILKETRQEFFIGLFISCSIGSLVGGIVTAMIVKKAKVAYSMVVGLILLFIASFEVILIKNHPVWYRFTFWLAFFPFSWIGSKIIEKVTEKNK
jgi:hypothetical protein